ncbi:hypothetical protein GWK87_05665 [Staphylococcus schleiferi subsp. coagulans]|uniref:YhgE/Pip domain-containing protein n=1 Tax=Staphylococcus coagulans TaxID=74706 RepID=UPI0015F812A4|nr:ABC transporter permease [Staphylococcus coagulans]MBA8759798.1 hypothetical protein [Staphylococcus coagulans]MBA8768765.1 hypothetical protein [Staphylococcus coagulans]
MSNRKLWIVPLITVTILLILATAFYPAYNPKPNNVPMAIVNLDKGTHIQDKEINIGKKLTEKLKDNKKEKIQWHEVNDAKKAQDEVRKGTYAGAIILENHFSEHALSPAQTTIMKSKQKELQQEVEEGKILPQQIQKIKEQMEKKGQKAPSKIEQAQIGTYIDEGGQGQLANVTKQVLKQISTNINQQVSHQNVQALAQSNIDISAKQFEQFSNPVNVDQHTFHPIASHQANGNAAMVLFMPVWLASMITAVVLYFNFKNRSQMSSRHRQTLTCALTIGIDLIASFIGLAISGFSLLILGLMVWIGILAAPLFLILVFFSMQAILLPIHMVPKFYQQYILPWNPFKLYTTEIKNLVYLHQPLEWNSTIIVLISFILFGIISVLISHYTKNIFLMLIRFKLNI